MAALPTNPSATNGRRPMALVGPTLPFRGGIAQYTTALHRAMAAVLGATVSFRRQYPAWLYPGKSDLEPGHETHREPGVAYLIDSMNPLTWWKAGSLLVRSGATCVAFNWWTIFWAPVYLVMFARLRRHGVRIVLICHNLQDHSSGGLVRRFARAVIGRADAFLVHSAEHADILRGWFPSRPVVTHPLPPFALPAVDAAGPARGRLDLLFFGFVRPYKGLDILLDAIEALDDPSVHLTIVGEPWGECRDLLARVAGMAQRNVEWHAEYVDEAQAARYLARADLVVLPYRSASGSAVASLAHAHGKPVLGTRVGGLTDVIEDGVNGFLVEANSRDALVAALRALDRERLRDLRIGTSASRTAEGWASLGAALGTLCPGGTSGIDAHASARRRAR